MSNKEFDPSELPNQMKDFYDYCIRHGQYVLLLTIVFFLASCNPIRIDEARQMNSAAHVIGRKNNIILEWVRMSDFKKSYKGVITWYGLADALGVDPELLLLINEIELPYTKYSVVSRTPKKFFFLPEGWQQKLSQDDFELLGQPRNPKYVRNETAPVTIIYPTPDQQHHIDLINQFEPDRTIHIVQQGENLFRIAQRYGTTVEAIVEANNIPNPSLIFVGQVLKIP